MAIRSFLNFAYILPGRSFIPELLFYYASNFATGGTFHIIKSSREQSFLASKQVSRRAKKKKNKVKNPYS